jgi:hypothetical protein
MKTSKLVLTTACVAVSLSLTAVAMAQSATASTATTKKPAATSTSHKTETTHKGNTTTSTTTITATVSAVDAKTRHVTLKDDAGKEYSFVAEPYVKNLGQVKVGDMVTVAYTEAVAWQLKKDNTMTASSSETMSSAPAGQKPAATVGSKTTVTVTITAIDPQTPSVSFTGPAGNSMTVKVKDPKKLEGVSVGDKVDITYSEALAVKVTEAPMKK